MFIMRAVGMTHRVFMSYVPYAHAGGPHGLSIHEVSPGRAVCPRSWSRRSLSRLPDGCPARGSCSAGIGQHLSNHEQLSEADQLLRARVTDSAQKNGTEYVEFPTGVGVLAIFSANAQEKYIPHSAEPGNNRSAILEFRVPDADKEYKRLQVIVTTWV